MLIILHDYNYDDDDGDTILSIQIDGKSKKKIRVNKENKLYLNRILKRWSNTQNIKFEIWQQINIQIKNYNITELTLLLYCF